MVDRGLEARLARLGAVGATDEGPRQIFDFPAGALGAGAGRELGASRTHGRLGGGRHGLSPILADEQRPVGRAWPGAVDTPNLAVGERKLRVTAKNLPALFSPKMNGKQRR